MIVLSAHLIINSDVMEGSRKASGEVISLSSEEKHQAGGIIQGEFNTSQHRRNVQQIFHFMKRWKDFDPSSAKDKKIRRGNVLLLKHLYTVYQHLHRWGLREFLFNQGIKTWLIFWGGLLFPAASLCLQLYKSRVGRGCQGYILYIHLSK